MRADEAMVKRIAGLLAKAEATEFDEERDAFLAGAQRLMREHAITEADVDAVDDDKREQPCYDLWQFSTDSRLLAPKRLLVSVACRLAGSGTTPVEVMDYPAEGHWCGIVGYPTEAAVARMAYPSIWTMADAAADRAMATQQRVREDYLLGFAQALMDKLREVERTSPGLVPVTRKQAVHAAVAALEPSTAPVADEADVDRSTFLAGYAAGAEADLDIGGHAPRLTPG